MLKRLLLPVALLALAAFALAACGSSESDEDKVVDVIETSVTSTDPADCEALSTLAFMEQSTSSTGKDAVKACEEDAEDTSNDAEDVTVSEVEVDGSDATANVALVGGSLDGQTVTVALVEEDGDWKMDRITGFTKFDKESLVNGFEENFEESEVEAPLAGCIVELLDESSNEELEELIVSGGEEGFVELAEECE